MRNWVAIGAMTSIAVGMWALVSITGPANFAQAQTGRSQVVAVPPPPISTMGISDDAKAQSYYTAWLLNQRYINMISTGEVKAQQVRDTADALLRDIRITPDNNASVAAALVVAVEIFDKQDHYQMTVNAVARDVNLLAKTILNQR